MIKRDIYSYCLFVIVTWLIVLITQLSEFTKEEFMKEADVWLLFFFLGFTAKEIIFAIGAVMEQ